MSLKSIDMQMAIHRNSDAGRKQNELTHKPGQDQSLLAGQNVKKAEQALHQATGVGETHYANIREGGKDPKKRRGEEAAAGKKTRKNDKAEPAPPHPYKGRHIDLSL